MLVISPLFFKAKNHLAPGTALLVFRGLFEGSIRWHPPFLLHLMNEFSAKRTNIKTLSKLFNTSSILLDLCNISFKIWQKKLVFLPCWLSNCPHSMPGGRLLPQNHPQGEQKIRAFQLTGDWAPLPHFTTSLWVTCLGWSKLEVLDGKLTCQNVHFFYSGFRIFSWNETGVPTETQWWFEMSSKGYQCSNTMMICPLTKWVESFLENFASGDRAVENLLQFPG